MKQTNKVWCGVLLIGLGLQSLTVSGQNLTHTLKATLVTTPPVCTLNSGQQSTVTFGEVLLPRIDGKAYQQALPLTLNCEALANNSLTLTLQGDAVAPNFGREGILKTGNPALGLVFYAGETFQPIATGIAVTYPNLPKLTVAPVMSAVIPVTDGGNFTASATLKVEYR